MSEKLRRGLDRVGKTPQEMLLEARDGLVACRNLFILSTIMLISRLGEDIDRTYWRNVWYVASSKEKEIAERLVAPAKLLQPKGYLTVPEVEENARKRGAEFIGAFAGKISPEDALNLATAIIDPHIKFTKEIQARMGVKENPLYVEEKPARKRSIFAGYGSTPKNPQLQERERVAC
ncbi:MAG: hypothetical protein Q7R31_02350 [Candidatus Levybacteria bacterium]|nr:hypothetical protein [Candidatus Levybacteria bacterium]